MQRSSADPLDAAPTGLSPGAATYADASELRAALLEAGVLVATRTDGLYHRSGVFEDVLQGVERYVAATREDPTAPRRWFPPIMARDDFLLTDYVRSFPDLIGSIDIFTGQDPEHRALLADLEDGRDWTSSLVPAEVVLSSSICHSLYGTLPTDVPAEGLLTECSGFAFRHEPSLDPARMQSFRMYEFVLVGTPAQVLAHRDAWLRRGLEALAALGLPARSDVANDPFFGRVGRMLAANQLDSELKYEIVLDLTGAKPTAIASSNYHEDHFGAPFSDDDPRRRGRPQRLLRLRPRADHPRAARHPRPRARGRGPGDGVSTPRPLCAHQPARPRPDDLVAARRCTTWRSRLPETNCYADVIIELLARARRRAARHARLHGRRRLRGRPVHVLQARPRGPRACSSASTCTRCSRTAASPCRPPSSSPPAAP